MSSQIGMFDGTDVPTGNMSLKDYGIQSEASDFRAHVAYKAQRVYVFPTKNGLRSIETGNYKELTATQQDIVTARGYAVPISHIDGLSEVLIPLDLHQKIKIENFMPSGEKGRRATWIVATMMKKSLIPLPVIVDFAEELALQISGTDIIVAAKLHVQVKCDYNGGDRRYGGTGNLFLQVAECNPFKQY
jgi:hypothetical protein